ncbi:MAG: hypothetical protein ACXACX_21785 [Candidatus Hodarchaeales archaeon]|jgi:hypothetical protein
MTKNIQYPIRFEAWDDFVKGLEIASDNGVVHCRPYQTIIISGEQIKAIKEAGISYSHVKRGDKIV